MEVINALGRRKTAVARVYLTKGKGVITVNNKAANEVFPTDVLQSKLVQPFALTDTVGKYNVNVNVNGGGINGQVEAIRLGISRALVEILEENKVAFVLNPNEIKIGNCSYNPVELILFKADNLDKKSKFVNNFNLTSIEIIEVY